MMMNINVGGRGDDELRHSFQMFDLYQYLPTFVASVPNVSSTISSHASDSISCFASESIHCPFSGPFALAFCSGLGHAVYRIQHLNDAAEGGRQAENLSTMAQKWCPGWNRQARLTFWGIPPKQNLDAIKKIGRSFNS